MAEAFSLQIASNIKDAYKQLNKMQQKQIPYAASQSINDMIYISWGTIRKQLPEKLDRPTPKTVSGAKYVATDKRNLSKGKVFFVPEVSAYLKWQIYGGTRTPTKGTMVPVNIKLNKFGNIPNRKGGIIKGKHNRFVGRVDNVVGIWQRMAKGKVKLLTRWTKTAKYKVRFPFNRIINGVVEKNFHKAFNKRLNEALKTAR